MMKLNRMRALASVAPRALQIAPLAGLALASGFGGAAWAQVREEERREQEIIVTSTILPSPRDEVLQGVTVLDEAAILETLNNGLGDTLAALPGIASTNFGPGASRPIIRGLDNDRVRILSNGVGVIDVSATSPDHAVAADGLEAARIEVLRGPAALAYGQNAIGGVVNVIDHLIPEKTPEKLVSGQALIGFTSVDDGTSLGGGVTLSKSGFFLRGEGFRREADDQRIPGEARSPALQAIDPLPDGEEEISGTLPNTFLLNRQFALSTGYAGEKGFIGFSFRNLDNDYGVPAVGEEEEEAEEGEEAEEALFPGERIVIDQQRFDVRAGYRAGLGPIDSVRFAASIVDYDQLELEPSGEVGTVFETNGFELRAELVHKKLFGFEGAFGAQIARLDTGTEGEGGEPVFLPPNSRNDTGLFLIERLERDRWGIDGGVRVDWRSSEAEPLGLARDFTTVSAAIGAHVRPVESLFLGLNLARTQRAPNEVELFTGGPHIAIGLFEVGDPNLEVETALSAEFTGRWTNEWLALETHVYANRFDNFIALVLTGEEDEGLPVGQYIQEDARFIGAEFSGRAQIFEAGGFHLHADSAIEIVRARFIEGGGNLPRIPPLNVTFGTDLEHKHFTLRAEAVRSFEQTRVTDVELPTEGFTFVNLRAVLTPFKTDRVALILEGRNLGDVTGRVHSSFLKDVAPLPGRTFRIALRANY